jgi:hypothetical protein
VIENLDPSGVGVCGIEWKVGDEKEDRGEAQSFWRNPEKIWEEEVRKC